MFTYSDTFDTLGGNSAAGNVIYDGLSRQFWQRKRHADGIEFKG